MPAVTWDRGQRDHSKEKKKTLFAVGCDGRDNPDPKCQTGCYIMTGTMPDKHARLLYMFGQFLSQTKKPNVAFKKAMALVDKPVRPRRARVRRAR